MLHQTLIPSSSLSFPCSAPLSPPLLLRASNAAAATATATQGSNTLRPPAMPSYAHHHSSLDGKMEALKSSCRSEEAADEGAAAAPAAWGMVERDGFSVEDLLDLEEFCEAEKDGGEEHELAPVVAASQEDMSKDESQQSSVVSFELVPPPPPPAEIVDLPAHDVEELEWVSRIMDDSLSELPPPPPPPASVVASLAERQPQRRPQDGAYRALPPASYPLRTPTICALSTEALVPVKAKRSKRSRASAWSLSGASPFSDSTSSSSTTTTSSCSSSASFSPLLKFQWYPLSGTSDLPEDYSHHLLPPGKKSKHGKNGKNKPKKRGRKPKQLPPHPSSAVGAAPAPGDRRCSHCGVQKTPQWRAGPEGAKTLCNACGVRYKSGRLLPEYRPACSPTFVSAIHSNSHRKVLEMRRKKEAGILTTAAPAVASF
ncbi:GATA transcription factor 5-like [Oryza brachyantha]|uniref:GATA transcription factor 5-like n=1 Tax=Oryza brachyantha TaxID=4533 RepID=UPI001ADC6EA7|nr:GATA transcription factor 5-like [Oryza brachyantha]